MNNVSVVRAGVFPPETKHKNKEGSNRTECIQDRNKRMKIIVSLIILILLTIVLLTVVHCMEHHKFKKCDENGFCNRLRRSKQPSTTTPLNAKKSHYVIEATKLTNKDSFTAKLIDLKNKRYNGPLKLLINVYENGIFRLRIREWTDIDNVKLEKRYEVKDVLMQHVNPKAFDTHNEQKLTLGKYYSVYMCLYVFKGTVFTCSMFR
jgi:hypothetical protein